MADRTDSPQYRDVPATDILLPAYNGSSYFDEQIESLRRQSVSEFRVVLYDDRSEDDTQAKIDALVREEPARFRRIASRPHRLGACAAFADLLAATEASRVMFCDHDDVWLPNKIERTLEAMCRAESRHGPNTPILVFTDLQIVDASLRLICRSYWQYQRMDPRRLSLPQQLTQNVPSGCTMMLNRPLVERCRPIPPQAVMHDHWVSLVAAALGRFEYVPEATVLYRQHGRNVFGATGGGPLQLASRARQGLASMRERFYRNVEQAKAFLDRYRVQLDAEQVRLLEAFASLQQQGPLARRATLLRHRILKSGLARNLASMVVV